MKRKLLLPALLSTVLLLTTGCGSGDSASASSSGKRVSTLNIDFATYNPLSLIIKDKGWLEQEFAKDGIGIRWVQTLGSNKALEFLNAGSIDFGSSAGAAGGGTIPKGPRFPGGRSGSSARTSSAPTSARSPACLAAWWKRGAP